VLATQTNNPSVLFNRALACLDSGKLEAARADFKTLQLSLTNSFQVAYGLGEIAWRQHDTNEAVRNYEIYLASAKTNTPAMLIYEETAMNLARLESGNGHWSEVAKYLKMVKSVSPNPDAIQKQIDDAEKKVTDDR